MENSESKIIGVLSDTHDQISNLIKSIEYFNSRRVELVIHCGDWVSPFTLIHYAKLNAPLYSVLGNNDGDEYNHIKLAKKIGVNVRLEKGLLVFSHYGKRIIAYHGYYQEIVKALVKCGDYDVVLHGHTHEAKVKNSGKVLSINPGTLIDFTDTKKQGASIGLYNAERHAGEIVWLDDI